MRDWVPFSTLQRLGQTAAMVLTVACVLAGSVWAQRPDPAQLVAKADAFRQVYPEAVMQVRLTRQSGEDAGKETLLRVAVRGSDASLIRVLQGADQGQQLLMLNEGLWLKLPRSARTLRITPMQRLLGDASVGDIGRLRWQADYLARYAEPAEITVDGTAAWRIDLAARDDASVAHSRILVTLSKQDARPLEAVFHLKSGKAVKAVRFGPVEPINDRQGVRRMEFRDLVKADSVTRLVLEKVEPRSIDSRLFTLESLGTWQ